MNLIVKLGLFFTVFIVVLVAVLVPVILHFRQKNDEAVLPPMTTNTGVTFSSSTTSRTTTNNTISSGTTATINPCVSGNLRWNTTGITVLDSSQISSVKGIYIDGNNALYVTDADVVWKLLNNATNATIVAGIRGSVGWDSTQLNFPQDVYIDKYGNMYVVDTLNYRVQKFVNGSTTGITIAGITGSQGSAANQFAVPLYFTFDSTDTYFYIIDLSNNNVMQYLTNSTTGDDGTRVAGGYGADNTKTSLSGGNGIHYLPLINPDLFITTNRGHTVMRWTPGASSGVFVAGVPGVAGSNSTLLNQPRGIRIDKYLNMFVVDFSNHRVQMFCANNPTGITIAGTGIAGNSAMQLNTPRVIAFDTYMNMYIGDAGNNRVQKFLKY
ncbi:hypothetical protein I4U23_005325 [Adineta vaga]|nr:hypothetical protein I4U23_005325 [Adineta vaga]